MQPQWPPGWQEYAAEWKLSPMALAWAYRIHQAVQDYGFPLMANSRCDWAQFQELEHRQKAWARTEEGRNCLRACGEIEGFVHSDRVPKFKEIAAQASPKIIGILRGQRHRLLTAPNSALAPPFVGTNPPDVILFSLLVFATDPSRAIMRFWSDWWFAIVCIQAVHDGIMKDPYKNSVLMLRLREEPPAKQSEHLEVVRSRLRLAARHIRGADRVDEVTLHDYLLKEAMMTSADEIYDFQERLLAGQVASPRGYVCDVRSALKKWNWRFEHQDDMGNEPDPAHPEEIVLDEIAFGECGRLLDRHKEFLERVVGKGATRIAQARYENPDLTQKELAKLLDVSESKIGRANRRALQKRVALNRRFETNRRLPRKK